MANRLYSDAVDFRGNDHDRVGFDIFCDRSGCRIKVKCISSCRNCNGKGGTHFGIPIPVGQIKADNKVMRGFFSIRAGADGNERTIIIIVIDSIGGSAGSSDRRTPLIGIGVVFYKFEARGIIDFIVTCIFNGNFINSGGYFFHSDIGGIPVVETSDNTNRKSSIGIAAATLRQRGDGQQGEE